MRAALIGRQGELRVFFCGWGMDERPFLELVPPGKRLLLLYDYRDPEIPAGIPEEAATAPVLAWSLGVYWALRLRKFFRGPLVALSGTGAFAHREFGIDPRLVRLTLEGLKRDGEVVRERFFFRMFSSKDHLKRFRRSLPQRALSEAVEELAASLELPPIFPSPGDDLRAVIPREDRIFPPRAQRRFWERAGVPTEEISGGHFPFYARRDLWSW
ncbi:MAG TPA: DUF452 family protein [Thermosulfurimonas dismutans]|uniref:DUF452 family protein n=1 Tax=Thermosulfurimonas dismutans TaxID=999894 RepID=A0A7C3GJV6_9BACT|nr:DUF452 family protein [Thermosulfurimonas dismutans]